MSSIQVNKNINKDDSILNLKDKTTNIKYYKKHFFNNKYIILISIFLVILLIVCCFILIIGKSKTESFYQPKNKKNKNLPVKNVNQFLKNVKKENYDYNSPNSFEEVLIKYEMDMPHLKELNKKRTFDNKLPFPKDINCKPHFFSLEELLAFMSFLTKNTIFFETGSGCSSIIANLYAKKVISIEGSKIWYEKGIKNGLNNSLIFKDIKSDNNKWSIPGAKNNLKYWKNYFQSYRKEYNADIIFIDGRFKVATAMDIFNKIKDDTIILIHEYKSRPLYYILEEYYNYIYHWNTLII